MPEAVSSAMNCEPFQRARRLWAAAEVRRAADAARCLRALGRGPDAELVLRALRDDATRAAAEKALLAPAPGAPAGGDLVIAARWDGGEDLDLSLVAPDGSRVSWMGGRTDVSVTDATSSSREQLAIRALRRGNYLVEVGRGGPAAAARRAAPSSSASSARSSRCPSS